MIVSDSGITKKSLIEEQERLRERVADLEREHEIEMEIEDVLRENQEAEHQFSEQLVRLVEINNELTMCETIDDLCREAVRLSRDRLGFERVGIWFLTEEPDKIAGSFGVDPEGRICDERGIVSRVEACYPEGRVVLSREPLVIEEAAPILDSRGNVTGRGTQAFAPINDGEKPIGHISMDNNLSGEKVTRRQCDLLRLFGSAIGYLYARKRVEIEHKRTIEELRQALAKIKTLSGLVPICCSCKKIRDDKGFWNQLEEYIQDHSDAEFSHGICPDCAQRLYPELYEKKLQNEKEEREKQ